MGVNIEALREHLLAEWNYLDVLALALAKTKKAQFTSDPARWNQVIFDFKEHFRDQTSELLEGVLFDQNVPFAPYSPQVAEFFSVMRRSRAINTLRLPRAYQVEPEVKEDIIKDLQAPLQKYDEVLSALASEIDEKLAIA